jgi:hypothetical protein
MTTGIGTITGTGVIDLGNKAGAFPLLLNGAATVRIVASLDDGVTFPYVVSRDSAGTPYGITVSASAICVMIVVPSVNVMRLGLECTNYVSSTTYNANG